MAHEIRLIASTSKKLGTSMVEVEASRGRNDVVNWREERDVCHLEMQKPFSMGGIEHK